MDYLVARGGILYPIDWHFTQEKSKASTRRLNISVDLAFHESLAKDRMNHAHLHTPMARAPFWGLTWRNEREVEVLSDFKPS
jgi:hypothetical protein